MTPAFAATIIVGGSVLFSYSLIERRLNQRICAKCGYRASKDNSSESCPGCLKLAVDGRSRQSDSSVHTAASTALRLRQSDVSTSAKGSRLTWASVVLVLVPLLIACIDVASLLRRHVEPPTKRAIWAVKDSSSRIESFSVQQYLYSTLYQGNESGAKLQVVGWSANARDQRVTEVEFAYSEGAASHTARWSVDGATGRVQPENDDARNLSWTQ